MKIINWNAGQDFINHLFLSIVDSKEVVCLWQTNENSTDRYVYSGEVENYAVEKKLVEFLFYEDTKFLNEKGDLYFYSQSSDIIFKTTIIKKNDIRVICSLPEKLILLSDEGKEGIYAGETNKDLLDFISDIKENLQKINFAKNNVDDFSKKIGFSKGKEAKDTAKKIELKKDKVSKDQNVQNLFIKLEDLVEDPVLVLENIQKIGIVLNGYGPFDLKVDSFSASEAVIISTTKTLFNEYDEIEVVSLDGVMVKNKFKGIVKRVKAKGRRFTVKVEFVKEKKRS